jgi:hypothetical protein
MRRDPAAILWPAGQFLDRSFVAVVSLSFNARAGGRPATG